MIPALMSTACSDPFPLQDKKPRPSRGVFFYSSFLLAKGEKHGILGKTLKGKTMALKTEKKIDRISLAIRIAVIVCLALVIFIGVTLILLSRGMSEKVEQKEVETTQAEPTEEPTIPEPTLPKLNLPKSPYSERDFDYVGKYLTCVSGPCMLGVDVSYWQFDIIWPLVKAAGMDFAMVRLAWRGSSEGTMEEDSYARINYQGAKDAGLLVGGYFFSQAITVEEAIEEAQFVLEMAKDMEFDMPIVFDWEQTGGRTAGLDARTLTDCAKAFCETIEAGGLEAMVYFNVYFAYNNMYLEELTDYGFWLAMYDSRMDFPYKIDMWQHTDSGSVPGITGPVDMNILLIYDEAQTKPAG